MNTFGTLLSSLRHAFFDHRKQRLVALQQQKDATVEEHEREMQRIQQTRGYLQLLDAEVKNLQRYRRESS